MANTLFIGKDLPDGLEIAEAIANSGRKVFAVSKSERETENFVSENILSATWNKTSAVSALSFLINAETKLGNIEEILIYFDANYYTSKFELDKTEEISSAVDSMITGYCYIITEILKRIDQTKEKITVAFLTKEHPSKFEVCSSKSIVTVPASSVVSASQAAFVSMAENFSTYVSDRDFLSVILAKCSAGNELYKNEKLIGDWVVSSFDAIKNAKNHQTFKQAGVWNKVGSKISTGFALFR